MRRKLRLAIYPDFSGNLYPKGKNDVKIDSFEGSRPTHFRKANKKAGYDETPDGYTWHHHQEQGRMQLVDSKKHSKTGHTGGFSIFKKLFKKKKK